jgi:integrase/recombinase XerD
VTGPQPRALDRLVVEHVDELETQGYTAATLDGRRRHLRHFARWCEIHAIARPTEVTPAILERYRAALFHHRQPNGRLLAASTQAGRLVAVRMLFRWLTRTGHVLYDPAAHFSLPRQPRRLPKAVLSVSEVERVLARPDIARPLGLRDRAILELLYSSGLRRKELLGLGIGDVDFDRGIVRVREGKGGHERFVPIGERAVRWIAMYLDRARPRLTRDQDAGTLFVNSRGRRIRPNRLTERLHQYVLGAGLGKSGSCHIWRHTTATLMHENGADIRDLQELLGHAAISSTQIYTHVAIRRLKEVHQRTHPAADSGPEMTAEAPDA